ncbi:unnamed protein product [Aureobasidium mustum]|uniref:F-box domain-containing protein n=1 Tax=Aureobasidium mustum TaxID=2773714 RepID=A0A9N8K975_9PEZI|nr:unnamed protein product [Aureobasidium mustum]
MESLQDDRDLSLTGMPTEILSIIVNLTDAETLIALRLTNKRLCAIASGPLALEKFSERKHVASQYSMNALIEITAHPFFGKFVKTVTVCGSRPKLLSGCSGPAPQHRVLRFRQLRDKLKYVFSNIKRNSSSVCIGAGDQADYYCWGSEDYARCVDGNDSFNHDLLHTLHGQSSSRYMSKTFGYTFQAAQTAGCDIEKVKIDISDTEMSEMLQDGYGEEVQALLQTYIIPLSKPLSLDLTTRSYFYGERLEYDNKTGKLCMLTIPLHSFPDDECDAFPNVQPMLNWLKAFPITQIEVRKSLVASSDLLSIFCVPKLERLTLHNIQLHTGEFEVNFWSTFLLRLSRLTTLRYLEISFARYYFSIEDHFVLPSGNYDFGEHSSHTNFRLMFSEDGDEAVILSDHTSISVELKALADRVAQMERDKVAEIERDGYVRDDLVGISTYVESDADVYYYVEDDESDKASEDNGELEGNDDGDEHEHTAQLPAI